MGSSKTGKMADVFSQKDVRGLSGRKSQAEAGLLGPPALLQSKFQTLSKNDIKINANGKEITRYYKHTF